MKDLIYIIDGTSYLYRAFHAMPPLTSSKGLPTGAIKGVSNMLTSTKKQNPDVPIVVTFDAKGKNFRHQIFEAYKAARPPMPEELRPQIQPVKDICKAMGFTVLSIAEVEADDVIATLTKQSLHEGLDVIISTLDKDLMQLVQDPKVRLYNSRDNKFYNEQKVFEKFGVHPNQITELLALVGDTSDGIPGIPKVGPKTAAKWLTKYQSLEEVIMNAESIKGVVGQNLRDNIDILDRNLQLVSLKDDVDLDITFSDINNNNENEDVLKEIFTDLEFSSPVVKKQEPTNILPKNEYETVLDQQKLKELIRYINSCKYFALDTETTSLDVMSAELVGIAISTQSGSGFYIPIGHNYEGAPQQLSKASIMELLAPCLEMNQDKIVGQNLKYDLPILNSFGIKISNFKADTMLMSYVLNSTASRHNLDALAKLYLNRETITYETVVGSASRQIPFSKVFLEQATAYAAEDADITISLYETLLDKLTTQPELLKLLDNLEYPLLKVLSIIERNGAKIDVEMLEEYSAELSKKINSLSKEAYALAGQEFNLDSPKQLVEILFNKQKLPVLQKTPKGQPSTNEAILQRLAEEYPLPKIIIQYRTLAKLKSTYTDSLTKLENEATKRIHTSYHQAVTSTGRLSSANPNLQNIPIKTPEGRKIREAFIPEEGNSILSVDYSQIELRIMAHLSKDSSLCDAFLANLDVHSATAADVFDVDLKDVTNDQRRAAKAINFGLMYGMSAFGLTKQINVSRAEAQTYLDEYFKKYKGVETYMQNIRDQAKKDLFVETIMGRKLHVADINSSNFRVRSAAERAAINAPLQGSAADIIKVAMINIQNWIFAKKPPIKMIMQVHDELIFEVQAENADILTEEVKDIMENAVKLDVPLLTEAGIGKNWNESH
ncbi:MAG: DNA polymerase I [Pseudomonadota bacterium]|nr:DNA polymerase I [Pseudomonadota bacterium]